MSVRRSRLGATLVLAVLVSGCFHYVPVEAVPPQGTAMRIRFDQPVAVELQDITANRIVELRGEVVTNSSDQLVLSAFAMTSMSDFEHLVAGETVYLSRAAIAQMEQKVLSPTRTGLAVAVVVGLGFLVDTVIRRSTGRGENDGNPPPIK